MIWDVAVDLRPDQPTYGKWYGIELSAENKKQFYIPPGFAHGYSVLSEEAEVMYKCDSYYDPASEGGIRLDDEQLNIDWKVPPDLAIISEKDRQHPRFSDFEAEWKHR